MSAITGPMYRNLLCCDEDLCNAPLEPLSESGAAESGVGTNGVGLGNGTLGTSGTSEGNLQCYTGYSPSSYPVAVENYSTRVGVLDACASYQFVCGSGNTACSQDEQLQRKVKWAYVPMNGQSCANMRDSSESVYTHVKCCADDLCNKPDPALDPDAKLVDGATSSSAGRVVVPHLRGCWAAAFLSAAIAAVVFG